MAKGEKGRRRPWREKKPQGPSSSQGKGIADRRPNGVRRSFSKPKKHANVDEDFEDVPDFSDLSDDDAGNENVGAKSTGAESIKDDVAKFAADLGLAVQGFSASGFDDRDFRKPPKKVVGSNDKEKTNEGKGKAGGKGNGESGNGGANKKQTEKRDAEKDEKGAFDKKTRKGDKKSAVLPPPPEGGSPDAGGAFTPAESFFEVGGGGVEDAPMGPWYEQAGELSSKLLPPAADVSAPSKKKQKKVGADVSAGAPSNREELLRKMRAEGEGLLHSAAEAYERGQGKSGKDVQWLVRARKAGTSADKVAAMTVMVQEDPVGNVRSLDALLGMVSNKGGKRNAAIAIDALRELFVTSLLPDRKLKYLAQQPDLEAVAAKGKDGEPLVRFWYWEDALKQRYDTFVTSLDALSRDNLQFLKEKALKTLFDLLVAKPEQEAKLLSALVNKLGDPERKVASKAGYLMARLLEHHPAMKRIVVQEVEAFVFRPHVGLRARYYAVVFLNQIILSKKGDGSALAKSLIGLYFGLFKALTALEADTEDLSTNFQKSLGKRPRQKTREVKKIIQSKKKRLAAKNAKGGAKGAVSEDSTVGVDSRILSAILTGVNRAFPYVAADDVDALLQEHTPELFRMVHAGNFNVSVQALLLLHQLMSAHQAVSERFYRALYAVLLSPALAKSSKAALFLSVLFKAMKADLDSKRIAAFAKRLLQITAHQPPPFTCGALLLVSEVLKIRPVLWGAIQQPEDKGDDLEHFEDVREEGDGLPDSPKSAGGNGVHEPQSHHTPGPATAADISGPVLGFSAEDDVSEDEAGPADDSDGDSDSPYAQERRTRSADVSTSSAARDGSKRAANGVVETGSAGEGLHDPGVNGAVKGGDTWPAKGRYDSKSREPSFCHAETACWWELTALAAHAHPSVAAMAKTLLAGANVLYDGDPLRDLALSIFLDRFVEKKPRATKGGGKFKGASLMQPLRKGDTARSHLLVGGEAFAAVEESRVAAEDAFFYKFYVAKAAKKPARKRSKGGDSSDEDSDGEAPSAKKAKKEKRRKAASGNESDEDIENVDSDDDALEKMLERGMDEGEGSEDEGGQGDAEEGGWDYDGLAKVLERDDDVDARSDGEESLDAAAESDDDDEGAFEGLAAAGSDDEDDADVSGSDDEVSDEGEGEESEEFDFGEDTSGSEGEEDEMDEGSRGGGSNKSRFEKLEGGILTKGKRKRAGRKERPPDEETGETAFVEEEEPSEGAKGADTGKGSKKRKKGGVGASPFAAMEEYAHLLE